MIGLEHIVKVYNGTYKQLAEELELSPSTVKDWISIRRPIPQDKVKKLSKIFNLDEEIFQKKLNEVEKLQIELDYLKMKSKEETSYVTLTSTDEDGAEYESDWRDDPYEMERRNKTYELDIETVMLKLRQALYSELYEFEAGNEGLKLLELMKRFTAVLTEEAPDTLNENQKKEWQSKHRSRINVLQSTMYFLGVYRKDFWGKPFDQEGAIDVKIHELLRNEDLIWSKDESKKYNPWDI